MSAALRLVASNPHPTGRRRVDAATLHRLADQLTAQVQAGNDRLAHAQVVNEQLNPLGVAAVATWMSRAGLSESQILAVMVGHTLCTASTTDEIPQHFHISLA
ncbi:MAG: hypothetical protein Q8M20_06940 [Rhodocyclaceae bacterium]|nr:hypothetical protein [Rhodocyclaceae bacterium]MDZ4214363.1 hypothetical protein [Rhodocyclaceae bacterium]